MIPDFYKYQQKTRCRIAKNVDGAGRQGTILAHIKHGQHWAIVVWDEEDEPELFKLGCLEMEVWCWADYTIWKEWPTEWFLV